MQLHFLVNAIFGQILRQSWLSKTDAYPLVYVSIWTASFSLSMAQSLRLTRKIKNQMHFSGKPILRSKNKLATVLYNKKILPFYYKLGMSWENLPRIEPGQFIMLRISHQVDPLLRRPFGVYKILGQGARGKGQGVEIVYKVVGKVTSLMT